MIRKIIKVTGIIIASLVALAVVILVVGLKKVDETPYFQTEYYHQTMSDLAVALEQSEPNTSALEAGFSVVNITPGINAEKDDPEAGEFIAVPMAGFGGRKGPADGVHDSLYVKAAALKVGDQMIVALSADILLIPPYVADSVAWYLQKDGIKREQLFLGATHTHSSIGATTPKYVGEKFSGGFNPNMISYLTKRFTKAIRLAVADIKPATVANKELRIPELVRNRMSAEKGRLNDFFTAMTIQQKDGKKAVIGAYAAHSTTLGEDNLKFSGDFPGYWQRKVEEDYADIAIYYAGTLGSHSHRGEGQLFERAKHMGEGLAQHLIDSEILPLPKDSVPFTSIGIPFHTAEMQFRVSKNYYLAPFISRELIPEYYNAYVQGLRIGDLVWITCPFELSGEIALDVKNALKLAGYYSMFTSFNGDYKGYVTPSKYYYDKTYESYLMGWYGPSMGDYTSDLLFKVANGLTGERL